MTKKTLTRHAFLFGKSAFWFIVGVILGLFFAISFGFILFQKFYGNTVYPGVYISNVNFGGKTEQQVAKYFTAQNQLIEKSALTFTYQNTSISTTAKDLSLGYNSSLLAHQAYSVGRSNYLLSDIVLIFTAYVKGVFLPPSFSYNTDNLITTLSPISQKVDIDPIDGLFTFENNKVSAFRPSSEGQTVDLEAVKQQIAARIPLMVTLGKTQLETFTIPIKQLKPKVSTEDVNDLGIKELIGLGTSLFAHSIPSRIYNITLASSRLNGVLVSPGEEFSFDKALGDVSKFTGYQQAYIIANGHTILGDGGGVCQVSTTLFRALLNAGVPITERHGHDYRVGYYEEDSPPGIDATVYVPTVDLKFKNDTGHSILIQTAVDAANLRLTFYLYGTSDGRKVTLTQPVVSNQTPAPDPLYTDDPTLPKGEIKQTDFAATGAHVEFSQTVVRNDKILISETFKTDYRPWQAVYLRGTKE